MLLLLFVVAIDSNDQERTILQLPNTGHSRMHVLLANATGSTMAPIFSRAAPRVPVKWCQLQLH